MVLRKKSSRDIQILTSSSSQKKVFLKVPIFKSLIKSGAKNFIKCDDDENNDFDKRFGEEACKWLSSGTISLSNYFENVTFSMSSKLDEWLYFLFSLVQNPSPLLNKYIACFDGSKINPIEEAYLVMKKTLFLSDTSHILREDAIKGDEEEVVAWLDSTKCQKINSNFSCSLQNCNDLECLLLDSDKKHLFLSLVNLEEESCWWDSDTESSVSSISKTTLDKTSEFSSSSSDCFSEDLNFAELEFNEPLVWPSDMKWNWRNLEGKWDDFFIMSPRKHENGLVKKFEQESDYNRPKHVNVLAVNENQKGNVTLRRVLDLKSRKISRKVVPLDSIDFVTESKIESLPEKCNILEDEFFFLCEEHPIESILGLEEFDGQEGIEKALWQDDDSKFASFNY